MEELEERPFLRYLMSLSAELLDGSIIKRLSYYSVILELYDRSQACVSAVFRILPPIAQKCFLYLLYQSPDNYRFISCPFLPNNLILFFMTLVIGERGLNHLTILTSIGIWFFYKG